MGQRNETFIFLACREHKTHTKKNFHWLHFFFIWLFLYHKEVTRARQTLQDNFLINEIGNAQFYRKLKYTCMQIWLNKIWYSHCPDLFVYTSSSLAFFLMQWVKSTVIFPSRPCFNFLCGQELFQQFLRDLSAKGIRLSVVEFNRKYMKLTKFVCDLRA